MGQLNFRRSKLLDFQSYFSLLCTEYSCLPERYVELGWQPVAKQKNFNILILSISTCFWPFLHFLLVRPGKGGNVVVAIITPGLKDEKSSPFSLLFLSALLHWCFQVLHYLTTNLTKGCCSWLRSPKGIISCASMWVSLQWDDRLAPFHSKRSDGAA